MRGGLTAGALALGLAVAAGAEAGAAGLCDRLVVPELLELECRVGAGRDADGFATIAPEGGPFAGLSRMSLRRLEPVADRLAWEDPHSWLERQMIVDLDRVADTVRQLADDPDSPLGGEMFRQALELLAGGLEGLSRLPLQACGEGAADAQVTCRFGVEPIAFLVRIKLVEDGDDRYAFNIRTFNEQRLTHFTAIANSFRPI